MIIVQLNDRAQPIDRGELYENPLDALLRERGWAEVTGGGSRLAASGEIAHGDIEIRLERETPDILDAIVAALERLGAPKGSVLRDAATGKRPFGTTEGLAMGSYPLCERARVVQIA